MENANDFIKELQEYTIEELKLIFETQKDLYTEEEMQLIEQKINNAEQEEIERLRKKREELEKKFPEEIICEKCDGPNPFKNDICSFCGVKLNKAKYYSPEYYEMLENGEQPEEQSVDRSGDGNTFRYVISFLIPLVGFIMGAILLSKSDEYEKSVGQFCIILSIISIALCAVIWFLCVNSMFTLMLN